MNKSQLLALDAEALMNRLAFPDELFDICINLNSSLPWDVLEDSVAGLQNVQTAEDAMNTVGEILQPWYENTKGLCFVPVIMAAMAGTERRLLAAGISEEILIDTFRCIPRMCNDYRNEFSVWGFDRAYWVRRQCCGNILRIGTLEYELRPVWDQKAALFHLNDDDQILSVHIPTDAKLTDGELIKSYRQSCDFYHENWLLCRPESKKPKTMGCFSWLLSPVLMPFLKEQSGIRRFASAYNILSYETESQGFIRWLFANQGPIDQLPEKTSLQRNVKSLLREGKYIGTGIGELRSPWNTL